MSAPNRPGLATAGGC